ncbi:hypothetical protein A3B57_04310 [Microgenomates group bacterium RIFCSPLOWO2_01_FULL_47_10]|nr:MAG: hypothetical protein A3B57_04310 [Microgenomates group bacterium RIFCSPLOWO2_01_FULL_47_10]
MIFKNLWAKPPSKLKNNLVILAILLLGLGVRLYNINTPLADWHSWRQADTASVAVEYIKNGIDLLHPKYLDLSNIPSGLENPQGYRMVEFPMVAARIAVVSENVLPNVPIHVIFRVYSIISSLFSLFVLYHLVLLFEKRRVAELTALIFAILPYNVFYSRAVLPEIHLVAVSLMALYSVVRFFTIPDHSLKTPWYWLAVVTGAIALLLKPTALFFALPALYVGWRKCKGKLLTDYKTYLFLALTFAPLLWWRWWIGHFPEGIPAFTWLLNSNGIRFKGAFFHWLFAERIGRLILGFWGLILLALGFLHKAEDDKKSLSAGFFGSWLISMLAYLSIFATGNVQHDYYQIILIPIICVYVAKGIEFLLNAPKVYGYSRTTCYILLTTASAFALAFSWFEVRGYYQINNPAMVEAGQAVDRLTPADALIIAPYGGDTAFLYQTNRRGWPIGGQIEKRIQQGADYYVTTALDDEAKKLIEDCGVADQTKDYTVINLHQCN